MSPDPSLPCLSRRQVLASVGATVFGGGALAETLDTDLTGDPASTDIIGHRGCAGLEPPNTIAGIERAIELGADGVELDVQQTKDDELILFHDPVLDWTTNATGPVSWHTKEKIETLRLDGEPIPSLKDALLFLDGTDLDIYLELKDTGYATDVLKEVSLAGLLDRTTIVSFDEDALLPLDETRESVTRGTIGSAPNPLLIEEANTVNASIVSSHYVPESIPWLIEEAHKNDMQAGVWTLKDIEMNVKDALSYGPDVLITNRPDWALKHQQR